MSAFRLAWRNLGRNRRRTALSLAGVASSISAASLWSAAFTTR